ncbi:MAG: selenocysteine lyase [Ignavibacteria bacterium GWF2_33_9]|nr:MAG: selenocysteine lyase [Ignavibacteria bacterium GWF2_33_9]
MLQEYFAKFRKGIVGIDDYIDTPLGKKKIVYADWTASGRNYEPIEKFLFEKIYPTVANTHTETSATGAITTLSYQYAQKIIKKHVNANENDVIITAGSGMTEVVNKFQRILGIRIPEQVSDFCKIEGDDKPVVFVTHMEHHSNHTSWLVTTADVVQIEPDVNGLVDFADFEAKVEKYKSRKLKSAAITGCTNVTGIRTDYYRFAKIIHKYGGYCFVDFAASAPYVKIDMHPKNEDDYLDAVFLSPHKFLGGPGSAGVVIFNSDLYKIKIPDRTGGGTVKWTNRWSEYSFFNEIEIREDGGTPGFIQTIKAALAIKLKEKMGIENILAREEEILHQFFPKLKSIKGIKVLAEDIENRLLIFSFLLKNIHNNLVCKVLNDYFGIQVRGGCSCAGTYGHYLFDIDYETSHTITDEIERGYLENKPGWVRVSIHPTTTDEEVNFIYESIKFVAENIEDISKDYICDINTYEFHHKNGEIKFQDKVEEWFNSF